MGHGLQECRIHKNAEFMQNSQNSIIKFARAQSQFIKLDYNF
jgi:hypothetical protein